MDTIKNKTKNAIKILLLMSLVLISSTFVTSCSDDDANMESEKSPIVMVHGSWQAAYAWQQVKEKLVAEGYQVTIVNLKGHGDDNTPVNQLTFTTYVNQVKDAVNAFDKPVILVGHSLGGSIITQAASEAPEKISKLVYIAGFIPQNGKSTLDYAALDPGSLLGPVLEFNADHSLAGLVNYVTNVPNIFIQDGTAAQKQFVLDHYRTEPVLPLAAPLNYTMENYNAAGKKYYVFTMQDNAISYPFQQQMATAAGITSTFTISTGHSPFISRPAELTTILEKIIKN